jgi:hypothetical protein
MDLLRSFGQEQARNKQRFICGQNACGVGFDGLAMLLHKIE